MVRFTRGDTADDQTWPGGVLHPDQRLLRHRRDVMFDVISVADEEDANKPTGSSQTKVQFVLIRYVESQMCSMKIYRKADVYHEG